MTLLDGEDLDVFAETLTSKIDAAKLNNVQSRLRTSADACKKLIDKLDKCEAKSEFDELANTIRKRLNDSIREGVVHGLDAANLGSATSPGTKRRSAPTPSPEP
jgi:ribosomal protein S20